MTHKRKTSASNHSDRKRRHSTTTLEEKAKINKHYIHLIHICQFVKKHQDFFCQPMPNIQSLKSATALHLSAQELLFASDYINFRRQLNVLCQREPDEELTIKKIIFEGLQPKNFEAIEKTANLMTTIQKNVSLGLQGIISTVLCCWKKSKYFLVAPLMPKHNLLYMIFMEFINGSQHKPYYGQIETLKLLNTHFKKTIPASIQAEYFKAMTGRFDYSGITQGDSGLYHGDTKRLEILLTNNTALAFFFYNNRTHFSSLTPYFRRFIHKSLAVRALNICIESATLTFLKNFLTPAWLFKLDHTVQEKNQPAFEIFLRRCKYYSTQFYNTKLHHLLKSEAGFLLNEAKLYSFFKEYPDETKFLIKHSHELKALNQFAQTNLNTSTTTTTRQPLPQGQTFFSPDQQNKNTDGSQPRNNL